MKYSIKIVVRQKKNLNLKILTFKKVKYSQPFLSGIAGKPNFPLSSIIAGSHQILIKLILKI